jgi:two-component system, NarL family, sensor kinase
MQNQYPEIFLAVVVGVIIALLLVGFIIAVLLLYKRKQFVHEQELLQSRIEIQEKILSDLSVEIHDNIGQILSVLKLTMSAALVEETHPAFEYMQECKQMLNNVIQSISDLSKGLNTDRVLKIGIVDAVSFELDKIQRTGVINTSFTHSGGSFQLPDDKEIFLFRVCQEIINNIIKHANASNITVVFKRQQNLLTFSFQDDGVGFDSKAKLQQVSSKKGIGLSNMINRIKLIGGKLNINSQPSRGTNITIELPVMLDQLSKATG